jgi:hypothetical protein
MTNYDGTVPFVSLSHGHINKGISVFDRPVEKLEDAVEEAGVSNVGQTRRNVTILDSLPIIVKGSFAGLRLHLFSNWFLPFIPEVSLRAHTSCFGRLSCRLGHHTFCHMITIMLKDALCGFNIFIIS